VPFGDNTGCRATGAEGTFDGAMTGVKKSAQFTRVGFGGANLLANTRGHLTGRQFGGSANNPRNFVAAGATFDNEAMNAVEGIIQAGITAAPRRQTVSCKEERIPAAAELVATGGGLDIDCTLTDELVPKPSGTCSDRR
jgi:hypothetical protein